MRPQATFSFFIFLQLFHFFTLLIAPSSSSSLLPPRPSFLLVPPSSLFLFLPRLALSQSLRIHKRPFFIDFDESVTDGRTNQRTNQRTNGHVLIKSNFVATKNHMGKMVIEPWPEKKRCKKGICSLTFLFDIS